MATDNQSTTTQAAMAVEQPRPAPEAKAPAAKPDLRTMAGQANLWTIVRIGCLVLSAILAVLSFAMLWSNGIDPKAIVWAIWWPTAFMVQFVILTWPWRAVPLKSLAQMFLLGMGLVFFASYYGEMLMTNIITAFQPINPLYIIITSDFVLRGASIGADVASPICEEVFKILPVVIFLAWGGVRSWKRVVGPLDVALLGGAAGAGFLFMENVARVTADQWYKLGPDRSIAEASPGIGPFYLFPNSYHGDVSVWMGHAEVTMFVGLCLGLGLMLRKKLPIVWLVFPAVGLLWAMWTHLMVNYGLGDKQIWAQVVQALNFNGGLLPYALFLGLLLAIVISTVTKYLIVSKDKEATLAVVGKETLAYIKANQSQPLLVAKKLWSLRHFWSRRHAFAYGVLYAKQQKPAERAKWVSWLARLRQEALGKI